MYKKLFFKSSNSTNQMIQAVIHHQILKIQKINKNLLGKIWKKEKTTNKKLVENKNIKVYLKLREKLK
jgi:hypothetical protein